MDVDLARTFLAVSATRSFVRAAATLNVTQSTVSARIKALEDRLGQPVFVRNKAGAAMTPAGGKFQRHAEAFVRIWQQARHDSALPPDAEAVLNVGAQFSLWPGLVAEWTGWMQVNRPEVGLRIEVGGNDALMGALVDGALDLAVVYTPQARPALRVERLFEDTLVLVATPRPGAAAVTAPTVSIDWGEEFRAGYAAAYPDAPPPSLHFGNGALALDYVLERGGAGYFPLRLAAPLIRRRRLVRVAAAPRFQRPAHLAWYAEDRAAHLAEAVASLKAIGAARG